MKKISVVKRIILILLIGIVLLILLIGIKLYLAFIEPDTGEILKTLLIEPQNQKLDTSEEKTKDIPFQITGEILYYLEESSGIFQYDYRTKETKKIIKSDISTNFKVIDGKIYDLKINDKRLEEEGQNINDIIFRDLKDKNIKRTLIKYVSDCIFYKDSIIFSRYEGEEENIYQYYLGQSKYKKILSIPGDSENEKYPGELKYMLNDYIVFAEGNMGGWLSVYNLKTRQWRPCFKIDFKEEQMYFWFLDIQAIGDFVYIQGQVCDSTRSALAGPYVVENAEENGIWEVNIKTGEQKHLTETVYHGGIYVLDHKLYGINDGKYEKVLD